MGFFSQGNYGVTNYLESVQEDTRYADHNGAYRTIVEGYENDRIFFEAMLEYDFKESSLIHEGASESDIGVLQENVFTSFFSKIKEMLKKLWSKIKAIFHGFIAKFSAKFGSDNKAFAKKYKTEIYKKNLTDFEAKYEKPKPNIDKFISLEDANDYEIMVEEDKYKEIKSVYEDFDKEEEEVEALKVLSGNNDVDSTSSFAQDMHEYCFEDKDTVEGEADVKKALTHLENSDKTINNLKKAARKSESVLNKAIKKIDDTEKNFYKNIKWDEEKQTYSGQGDAYKSVNVNATLGQADNGRKVSGNNGEINTKQKEFSQMVMSIMSKRAGVYKDALSKVVSSALKEAKFYISQDRMLVAKAVAYRPKTEGVELVSQAELDFFGDIAAWEAETDMR